MRDADWSLRESTDLPIITFSQDASVDTVFSVLHDWYVKVHFHEGHGMPDVAGVVEWQGTLLHIRSEGGTVVWTAETDAEFARIAIIEVA